MVRSHSAKIKVSLFVLIFRPIVAINLLNSAIVCEAFNTHCDQKVSS